MAELEGKVALVTGAGSGIGQATAVGLARERARVGVLSRTADEVGKTAEQIQRAGAMRCRSSPTSPMRKRWRGRSMRSRGTTAASTSSSPTPANGVWAPINELRPEEWDRTIDVNLGGTFLTLHFCVPHLKRAGGGSIVIVSSINGTRVFSNTGATAYSCTKAAQVTMAQMLALELAKHRIRVNAVCPGAIESRIEESTERRNLEAAKEPVDYPEGEIPLTDDRPGASEDVAELILFLASDRARHISGSPVWIDGAQSLLIG